MTPYQEYLACFVVSKQDKDHIQMTQSQGTTPCWGSYGMTNLNLIRRIMCPNLC